jgi:NhaP-type Na+/H+ or K+/H+ antiporter
VTLVATHLDFNTWLAIAGVLFMVMALSSAYMRRLPVSTAAVYLLLGMMIGPFGLRYLSEPVPLESAWFERTTEIALVISLFFGGLKLRQPLLSPQWRGAWLLAGPIMLATIALVAVTACYMFELPAALGLLLAAMLAPTDPVLASAVSVTKAADADRLRYALSGEAGLNDGMAFPFVLLALLWDRQGALGAWLGKWALLHLVWAVPAGLAIGFGLGKSIGHLAVFLRSHHRDNNAPTDFLALALIALSYVLAELVGALGFLAVFAAGVGLRGAERAVVALTPHPDASSETGHPPAEELVPASVSADHVGQPAIAAGVLLAETISFGDTAERLLELTLVVLVGASLAKHWDARALLLALTFFALIRPALTLLFFSKSRLSSAQRWLLGWFGVRGIGSLYYLSYALRHGLSGSAARTLGDLTISVVAVSIVVHGVTAQPLLDRYEKTRRRLRESLDRRDARRAAAAEPDA